MNTDLFDASVLCCACGGGSTATEEYVEDVVSGECVNLDNTALVNSYGYGCTWYETDGYAECPYMNTDYFDASILCCACGGGSIPGSNTSDDSTTIETGTWLWLEATLPDGSYELDTSSNSGTLWL